MVTVKSCHGMFTVIKSHVSISGLLTICLCMCSINKLFKQTCNLCHCRFKYVSPMKSRNITLTYCIGCWHNWYKIQHYTGVRHGNFTGLNTIKCSMRVKTKKVSNTIEHSRGKTCMVCKQYLLCGENFAVCP